MHLPSIIEPGPDWQDRPILCAGGRGNLDDVAAAILAQLLERCGIGSRVASYEAVATASYASLDMSGVQVVCLSYMNPDLIAHARYAVRRLRRRTGVPIVVGFWSIDLDDPKGPDLVAATRSDLGRHFARRCHQGDREACPGGGGADGNGAREPAAGVGYDPVHAERWG